MECKDCDFYKEVGPGWVCTDEEDWRNNGDPCCRYHPNASLTLFEGVTKEAHDKLKADYAALLAERDRLRECVSDFMSIYYERDVLCQDGSGHVDRCRCRKCVKHRARKAMEGRDGQ